MKLSLLDRYKIIKYAIKVALNPKVKVSLHIVELYNEDKPVPYVVFPNGYKYVDLVFKYFGYIAAVDSDFVLFNKRVASFAESHTDVWAKIHNKDRNDYGVLAKPICYLPDEVLAGSSPTKEVNVKNPD